MRIATRSSALALVQAGWVADLLGGAELVPITTTGDRERSGPDKEKWVKELELALLEGEADLAVHSAKDVPGVLPDGLELAGAPVRADARDALCGAASLDVLPEGARVGTSSVRRVAQLRALREDLEVAELRGNVDTRLTRLAAGGYDAIVLAAAGLERLGRTEAIGGVLDDLVPAPGQGTLALEVRAGDESSAAAARRITDAAAWTCLTAERAVVRALDASCRTPVGVHARVTGDGELTLVAFVGLTDGSEWLRDRVTGTAGAPAELGAEAARRLRAAGADDLLRRAEAMV